MLGQVSERAVPIVVRMVEGRVCVDVPFQEVHGKRVFPKAVRENSIFLKLNNHHGGFAKDDGKTPQNHYRYGTSFGTEDDLRTFLKANGVDNVKIVNQD